MIRDLCKKCGKKPVAVNYKKGEKIFYRSKCDSCSRASGLGVPNWYKAGYRLQAKCDKCGFTSKHREQFNVYYIDGNPSNCNINNLKTVCANCQRILHKLKLAWRQGDLTPDY